jgi:hypothetical protein
VHFVEKKHCRLISYYFQDVATTELYYITGGGAPSVQKALPKTWQIFMSAYARITPLVRNPRGHYH